MRATAEGGTDVSGGAHSQRLGQPHAGAPPRCFGTEPRERGVASGTAGPGGLCPAAKASGACAQAPAPGSPRRHPPPYLHGLFRVSSLKQRKQARRYRRAPGSASPPAPQAPGRRQRAPGPRLAPHPPGRRRGTRPPRTAGPLSPAEPPAAGKDTGTLTMAPTGPLSPHRRTAADRAPGTPQGDARPSAQARPAAPRLAPPRMRHPPDAPLPPRTQRMRSAPGRREGRAGPSLPSVGFPLSTICKKNISVITARGEGGRLLPTEQRRLYVGHRRDSAATPPPLGSWPGNRTGRTRTRAETPDNFRKIRFAFPENASPARRRRESIPRLSSPSRSPRPTRGATTTTPEFVTAFFERLRRHFGVSERD